MFVLFQMHDLNNKIVNKILRYWFKYVFSFNLKKKKKKKLQVLMLIGS